MKCPNCGETTPFRADCYEVKTFRAYIDDTGDIYDENDSYTELWSIMSELECLNCGYGDDPRVFGFTGVVETEIPRMPFLNWKQRWSYFFSNIFKRGAAVYEEYPRIKKTDLRSSAKVSAKS